jgi:PAS domain S-box-containing protein
MAAKTPHGRRQKIKKYPKNMADIILSALEYTTDGIVLGGMDGTVLYHNKAWLRIHALDENLDLRGKNIRDYERKELTPILDSFQRRLRENGHHSYQFGTVRRDGMYHDVHLTGNIIREFDPPVAVVILREVTDLVQTQKAVARRNVELSLLNDIHSAILKGRNKRGVIKEILRLLAEFIGAKAGGVYLIDYSKDHAVLIESFGASMQVLRRVKRVQLTAVAFKRIIDSRRTFVLEEDLPGYDGGKSDLRKMIGLKLILGFTFSAGIGMEYMVLLGLGEAKKIDPDIRTFFDAAAKRFAAAIERMDLVEALEVREKELHDLSVRLIESGEEERRQCSRMLHDEVGQAITALKLELEILEKDLGSINPCTRKSLEAARDQLRFISDGTRTLSRSLHPSMLDELGLVPTLNWYVDNFVRGADLEVDVEAAGFDEALPRLTALTLYRVAQESLMNVVRHAGASRVTISLTKGYPCVIMEVEDNGRGISSKRTARSKGLGLVSMRERVELAGGTFRISSFSGRGTKVRVKIPIEARNG